MEKTRPQCYEIPTAHIALAIRRAAERKQAVLTAGQRERTDPLRRDRRGWLGGLRRASTARPAA